MWRRRWWWLIWRETDEERMCRRMDEGGREKDIKMRIPPVLMN